MKTKQLFTVAFLTTTLMQMPVILFSTLYFFSSCDRSQDEKSFFSLEKNYIEIMQTCDRSIKIYNYNEDILLINNNPNIVDAKIDNEGYIHIHGTTTGEASLIITGKESNRSFTIKIKVVSQFAVIRLNFTDFVDSLFEYDWPVEIYLVNNKHHEFHMVYFAHPSKEKGELLYSGTYQFVKENDKLRYLILTEKNKLFKRKYDLLQSSDTAEQNAALYSLEQFSNNKLEETCYYTLEMLEETQNWTFCCSFYYKYYRVFPINIIEQR